MNTRNIFKIVGKSLINSKIFIQRSMSWVSILNSGLLLFLVLSKLQDYGFSFNLEKFFFPIFLVTILILIVLGYLEDKLGFFEKENMERAKRDPTYKLLKNIVRVKKSSKISLNKNKKQNKNETFIY